MWLFDGIIVYNNFVIYDQDDSKSLIKGVIRDMELDEKTFVPKWDDNFDSILINSLFFVSIEIFSFIEFIFFTKVSTCLTDNLSEIRNLLLL